jgi:arylsulfatase A-like enzyme
MNRREFLRTVGAGIASGSASFSCASLRPVTRDAQHLPNILVIVADDMGWGDVGYHGSEIETPHIDSLAREGLQLSQHYVAPTCSPTRVCLLTGRYASRFGVLSPVNEQAFPQDTLTLASALRKQGYDTSMSGKWHLGSKAEWGPRQFGFNHSHGSLAGGVHPHTHRYKRGPYSETWHRDDVLVKEEGHVTDLIGQEAVRRIEAAAQSSRPFFLYVPFTAVHIPIQEESRWTQRYAGKIANESRRRFAACATHMDHWVGEMMAALDRTDQQENTLTLFLSDNGAQRHWAPTGNYPGETPELASPILGSNRPWRGWKGELYEGGIRVPAVAHWPGRIAPGILSDPVHVVDWMPTLGRLTGHECDKDPAWDGQDIMTLLTGTTEPPAKQRQFLWRTPTMEAVRKGDWKLIVRLKEKRQEVYNLAEDPGEAHNLASQYPEKRERLTALLEKLKEKDARDVVLFSR